jgi:hypothetical protein
MYIRPTFEETVLMDEILKYFLEKPASINWPAHLAEVFDCSQDKIQRAINEMCKISRNDSELRIMKSVDYNNETVYHIANIDKITSAKFLAMGGFVAYFKYQVEQTITPLIINANNYVINTSNPTITSIHHNKTTNTLKQEDLFTFEDINKVLNLISKKYFGDNLKTEKGQTLDEIDVLLKQEGITMKKHYLESILHQLLYDEYISNYDNHWKPTWKAGTFLKKGGYKDKGESKFDKILNRTNIIVGIITAIVGVLLTIYLSI